MRYLRKGDPLWDLLWRFVVEVIIELAKKLLPMIF